MFEYLWDDDTPAPVAPKAGLALEYLWTDEFAEVQPAWDGDEAELRPSQCRCDIGTIDYSRVNQGEMRCRRCGRVWKLRTSVAKNGQQYGNWWPYPCQVCNTSPEVCRHFGKKQRPKAKQDDDE